MVRDESTSLKRQAAQAAMGYIASGMVVGLGHGSTAYEAILLLSGLLRAGALHDVRGVPCSRKVEGIAKSLGIPLTTLEAHPEIDLTIDGADEVSPSLQLIKGGGGALFREKIVAQASRRVYIIVDASKLVPVLGTQTPLPVEVAQFGWRSQAAWLASLGIQNTLRTEPDDTPYRTDGGNYILDCNIGPIENPEGLASVLQARAGIVAHGLFLTPPTAVIVAGAGGVKELKGMSGE
ncbi:MAG: ribose-5-phosphate isomerase RpiA [Armatimonadota bacterium]